MSVDLTTLTNGLMNISANSFSEAAYVAQMTLKYTDAFKNGQLSKSEFTDLIADLKSDQLVATTADEQEIKSALCALISEVETVLLAAAIAAKP